MVLTIEKKGYSRRLIADVSSEGSDADDVAKGTCKFIEVLFWTIGGETIDVHVWGTNIIVCVERGGQGSDGRRGRDDEVERR